MTTVTTFMANRLAQMFPGYFGRSNLKHDYNKDFGFPDDVSFDEAYKMYCRSSVANAAIDRTIEKCWVEHPFLLEYERDGSQKGNADKETALEKAIRTRFDRLRVWQRLMEADRRSMVGRYAGVVLRVADGQNWDQPLASVSGGLEALLEVIPVWEKQLTVKAWDTDLTSPTYGQPLIWNYNETEMNNAENAGSPQTKQIAIHTSRVVVWSADGTLNCRSALEPGFNDLITIGKIVGGGGEGFWKNAKSAPVLTTQPEADINTIAANMKIPTEKLLDAMNKQVEEYQKGFDKLLMLQGMDASSLNVNLPSPEHFFAGAVQSFAASMSIPLKVLLGTQTGERASTEDAREWAITCTSRRANWITPAVMELVRKLEAAKIIKPSDNWYLDWNDLTEQSISEKLDLATKMTTVNKDQFGSVGEPVFTAEEIREVAGYEPLNGGEFDDLPIHEEDEPPEDIPPAPEPEDE